MQADKNTSIFLKSYDKSKWQSVAFDKAIVTIAPKVKIPEKDFLPKGRFPIIDQAQKFISGFTNNENAINKIQKPVVIFGDHTCITKYIDFDFAHGADGIKILSTNSNILLPKYFYYWLLAYPIDSTEYKRHFSILKDKNIQCPNTKEQEYIIEKLTTIDERISNLEKLISKQESIKKSTINLLLKPKADWIKKTIGDVCSFFTSSSKSAYIDPDGQYFIVDMGAVSDDGTLIAQKRTNYAHDFLHKNDLIMPKDDIGGGNIIGKAVAIQENDKYILSDHVYKLQTELDATFLSYLINSPKINKYMRAMATGSAQLGISKRTVSKCELCFPADLGQQKAIAQKLGAIDEHINNLKQQLKKQRNLKQGLMQYFFGD